MTLRILAFEDSATMTEILKWTFAAEDVLLRVDADANGAGRAVAEFGPDVVLLDSTLPGADSAQTCRNMRARFPQLPVIFMLGQGAEAVDSQRHGASAVVRKPFDTQNLIDVIEEVTSHRGSSDAHWVRERLEPLVLVLANPANLSHTLENKFGALGWAIEIARNAEELIGKATFFSPALVFCILDLSSAVEAFLLCKRFKTDDLLMNIPFVIMGDTAHADSMAQHKKLKRRADLYVELPIQVEDLLTQLRPLLPDDLSARLEPLEHVSPPSSGSAPATDSLVAADSSLGDPDDMFDDLVHQGPLGPQYASEADAADVVIDLRERLEQRDRTLEQLQADLKMRADEIDELRSRSRIEIREDIERRFGQLETMMSGLADATRTVASTAERLNGILDRVSPLLLDARRADEHRLRITGLRRRSRTTADHRVTPLEADIAEEALELAGVFAERSVINQCVTALKEGKPLLLVGPPGTGKTTLAKHLCSLFATNRGTVGLTCSVALQPWDAFDFVGGLGANAIPHLGVFTEAVLKAVDSPTWLFVDELNRADPNIIFAPLLDVLNGSVAGKPLPFTSARHGNDDEHVLIPGDFRLICAMNEAEGHYLHPMAPEIERRFRIVRLEPPQRDVERRLVRALVKKECAGYVQHANRLMELTTDLMAQIRALAQTLEEPRLNLGSAYVIATVELALGLFELNADIDKSLDDALAAEVIDRLAPARSQTLAHLATEVFSKNVLPQCHHRLHEKLRKRSAAQDWAS